MTVPIHQPFITSGIGGIGVKYDLRLIKIDGSHLKLVLWQTGTNDDFDYSKPLYGNTLTKNRKLFCFNS